MSADQNARVVRECIEAVLKPDFDAVANAYADDAQIIDPLLPDPLRGKEAIMDLYRGCRAKEPDMTGEIKTVIADDKDMVMIEWQSEGTVAKPFPGMPDSVVGKRLIIAEVNICEMRDGKIVSNTIYADTGAIMRQLGLLPESLDS